MLKVENLPCIGKKMGSFRGEGAKTVLKEIIDLINENPNDYKLGNKLRKYMLDNMVDLE
jgi:hypothetical protein|tara:strand:- start:284 stop:460 length:177 start_codon:yes stop_codon:yes gene_type:complete